MEEKNENLKTIVYLILAIIVLFIAMCVVDFFVKIPPDSNNELILIRGFYCDFLGNDEQAYKDYTYLTNSHYHNSLLYKRKKAVELELKQHKKSIRNNDAPKTNILVDKKIEKNSNSKHRKLPSKKQLKDGDIDFNPYMQELQVSIKKHWNPPKRPKSNQVVLLFKIRKDGKLLSAKVLRSSGNKDIDKAALKALEDAKPLKPLPSKFKGENINIQFTFDYNAWGKDK